MQKVLENRILNIEKEVIFDVVMDIEKYPSFLSWCHQIDITKKEDNYVIANTRMKFHNTIYEYTSHIMYTDNQITINTKEDQIFKHLYSNWKFNSIDNQYTEVSFYIEYQFRNKNTAVYIKFYI